MHMHVDIDIIYFISIHDVMGTTSCYTIAISIYISIAINVNPNLTLDPSSVNHGGTSTSRCLRRSRADSRTRGQGHCTSSPERPGAQSDSAAPPSAASPASTENKSY